MLGTNDLLDAINLASRAHAQTINKKSGELYLLHPLRVMQNPKLTTIPMQICGVLHDVVEDCETLLLDYMEAYFGADVAEALDGLTRRKNETYSTFIKRCNQNPLSRIVKIADLEDNMNLDRLHDITDEDMRRQEKYQKALRILTNDGV